VIYGATWIRVEPYGKSKAEVCALCGVERAPNASA
jgi:hypothetical protein